MVAAGIVLNPSFQLKAEEKEASRNPRTILFVCEHGAARSVIAAAYFDKFAKEQGINYKAAFRGINPDPTLSPVAQKGLQEDGIRTSGWKPTKAAQKDLDEASEIITLGCRLPTGNVASKVTDWNDIPSPSQDYKLARDEITKRVQSLVDRLTKEERKTNRGEKTTH